MAPLERGVYEQLISEALQAELSDLGTQLTPSREPLRRAEAGDRLALHLARLVEKSVDGLPEKDRVERGLALARALIDTLASELGQEELRSESPVEQESVLRALLARLPDGSQESFDKPHGLLLYGSCRATTWPAWRI